MHHFPAIQIHSRTVRVILRFMGVEEIALVPKLIATNRYGMDTEFQFEHCGGDLRHKKVITQTQYAKAQKKSIDQLVEFGVDSRTISHHRANWALTRDSAKRYCCILIDVGRAVLAKKIRERVKSVQRFAD